MNKSRRSRWGLVALGVVVAAAAALVVGTPRQAASQPAPERSSMEQRLNQLIQILQNAEAGEQAHAAAIDEGMEILYGGARPLPTKGEALEQTTAADRAISQAELNFAQALDRFANAGGSPAQRGRALDLKLFIEQMNEVAAAVGEVTARCGEGDRADQPPCDQLHSLLNEETGEEMMPGSHIPVIRRSFSVKLRSPFVPPWFRSWEHDIRVPTLAEGQCAVVFKETRGLTVRLHLARFTVVFDPWVATFAVPRGTLVPIWHLTWVPTEYGKTWTFCKEGRTIRQTVIQRVKQDHALNFFWRYYPKDP